MHEITDIITIFNQLFSTSHNTCLIAGDDEPIYLPADQESDKNRIIFAHGFYASALHEIAHWLIAGDKRRNLVDYGYWYNPDGRTLDQQASFAKVEAKPQALEWILAKSAGFRFVVSLDNLNGEVGDDSYFKQAIIEQAENYKQTGLNMRSERLVKALGEFYDVNTDLCQFEFSMQELGS